MKSPSVLWLASLVLLEPIPAEVVISEILYHPASEVIGEEFIELHNTGPAAANVSGYAFTRGIHFTLPPATTIPAGGRLVIAADAVAFAAKYPAVSHFVAGWEGRLSNSSNTITLVDPLGNTLDEVDYSDDGDWGIRRKDWWSNFGHKGFSWDSAADGGNDVAPYSNAPADVLAKDRSLELVNAAFDNSTGQNWLPSLAAGGTPGAANSVAAADIAPVIREVSHFPVVPKSSEPVFVVARVTDDLAAPVTVTAHWRADGAASFSTEPMSDDGQHGDTLAGDGIFGASLPIQPDGTVVEFYVSATDGALTRTWPAPVVGDDPALTPQQSANCLYQVDNTVDAGAMPTYRLIMKAADKTQLTNINTNSGTRPYPNYTGESTDQTKSHARFNASFVSVDGTGTELRYRVGARNRGNGSRSKQPQGLNLMFPNDDPWKGVTQFNLNSQFTPWQVFGAALFAKAGLPAPQSRAVQFRWNGANPATTGAPSYGFYACNEAWNSDLIDNRFANDSSGNLYRSVRLFEGTTAGGTSIPNGGDFAKIVPGGSETLSLVDLYKLNYKKQTNSAEDSWTDLIGLTEALAKGTSGPLAADPVSYAPDYATAVRAVADVDEWMRWFAMNTLVDNSETNLSNGDGDDFNFYFGQDDPRARLMPYDLDTILGGGDSSGSATASLFRMISRSGGTATPMNAFMKHPEFAPIYYAELRKLLDGAFKPSNFTALADQSLGGLVTPSVIDSMKAFNVARSSYVAGQIPLTISVTTAPAVVSGYPRTTSATATLGGRANAITTRSIKVNGVAATWSAWNATWNATGVALQPGINRVLIQAFDADGTETQRFSYDVWRDDGSVVTVSSNITADTTWTAADGPWQVTGSVAVASGATLTIEPGASVYLSGGATFSVASGGRLIAEGTETSRIRFDVAPGSGASWTGMVINGTTGSPESRISHARFAGNTGIALDVNAGDVTLDHLEFGNTTKQYLSLDGASFVVSNCHFPSATSAFELVHGTQGVKAGGRGIFRQCWFGEVIGYNDALDFTGGQRPGPILQVIDCAFAGSGDDILDLDGTDAWIEGNIFLHCHKNGAPDSAAAISGGDDGGDVSRITIVGNLFYNVDHAVTAKQGNYYTFRNNTVVRQTIDGGTDIEGGILNLQDAIPLPVTTYGAGVYAEANIFENCDQLVRNYSAAASVVTLVNNLTELAWTGPGSGNAAGEPLFEHLPELAETDFTSWKEAQVMKQWLSLKDGSPARNAGPNGRDLGGVIPFGVCLSANVPALTNLTTASIVVGPAISAIPSWPSGHTHYRWRLDGGAWSAQIPIATPIALSGLTAGLHTLEVAGKNDAATWQDDAAYGPAATVATFTWTVNPGYVPPADAPLIRINEVLASNAETIGYSGVFPDLIELRNAGAASTSLRGYGLTDDPALPYKYQFPTGFNLSPGEYLVVRSSSSASVPGPKTGFGLSDEGEVLILSRPLNDGGGIVDSVTFGKQLPDLSIGRRPTDGVWDLCRPTFGTLNRITAQGDPHDVRINEWLASAGALSSTDFIELFNPGTLPVGLGGCFLTDNPVQWPDRHEIAPLTFIGASSYAVFKADDDVEQGADHLAFKLAALQGEIGFFDTDLSLIDSVVYGPQSTDVSQGRSPNGGDAIVLFTQPSAGGPNPGSTVVSGTTTVNLIPVASSWSFRSTNTDYSATFHQPAFDDSAWATGGQMLYNESSTLNSASGFVKTTTLPGNAGNSGRPYTTTYFRKHFNWTGSTSGVVLKGITMIDDGAVIYLNGQEALRIRMPGGPVNFNTVATALAVSNSDAGEEFITLPAELLVEGDNVIAVEVHQYFTGATQTSSDVVFGLKLDAEITSTVPAAQVVINEVLVKNEGLPNPDSSLAGWIELHNPSDLPADLGDMSLGISPTAPRAWVAPAGTTIPAGGYLAIQCNPALPASATNTGFGLNPLGGGLYLHHTLAFGGGLRDSVTWGNQLPDLSVGRVPDGSGAFVLTLPSREALNGAAATGPLTDLKINEWLANPAVGSDWFELFNTGTLPVALGGNYLTDTLTDKTKNRVPPLTFIGGSGVGTSRWLQFIADSNAALPGHVNFSLATAGESLGIFTASGVQVDALTFGNQAGGISQGRFPDGAVPLFAMVPTPGALNTLPEPDTDGDGMPDAWETANGFAPNSSADANLDADHDGMSNLAEYQAGTDPRNPASRFTSSLTYEGDVPTVRFDAKAGRSYTVQYSDSLGTWNKLADIAPQAFNGEVAIADPASAGQPKRFYRILTPAQP